MKPKRAFRGPGTKKNMSDLKPKKEIQKDPLKVYRGWKRIRRFLKACEKTNDQDVKNTRYIMRNEENWVLERGIREMVGCEARIFRNLLKLAQKENDNVAAKLCQEHLSKITDQAPFVEGECCQTKEHRCTC